MDKSSHIAGKAYTKDSSSFGDWKAGDKQHHDFAFKQLSGDELLKELGFKNLDDVPPGYIAGWASTPDLDLGRDVVATGAFTESLEERGLQGPEGIKFLLHHDRRMPAGHIVKLEQRTGGLWIEAQMDLGITYVNDFYLASKAQGGFSFSIGYRLKEGGFEFVDKGDDSYWLLTDLDLFEVSGVPFPMNESAVMTFIKDGEEPFETIAEFEKALVACGLAKSRNEANRVTRWVKGLSKPDVIEPPVQDDSKQLQKIGDAFAGLKLALTSEPE